MYLCCTLPEAFSAFTGNAMDTRQLGRVRIVDADFENPDGSPLVLDSDYFDAPAAEKTVAGPCASLKPGINRIKVSR